MMTSGLEMPLSLERSDSAAFPSQIDRRKPVNGSGRRVRGAPEAGQRHLGAACLKHDHPAAHGRIGEIMHEVKNVQHGYHPRPAR
jgi:hypothetical protein